MKFVGVLLPCYLIYKFKIYCQYFIINTENEPRQRYDHLDPFIDSLAVCIQFCCFPCIIAVQSLFSLNNENPTPNLNEALKVIISICIWGLFRFYPQITYLRFGIIFKKRNYDPLLTPGKDIDFSLYFACTIAAVVFVKNVMELYFQKNKEKETKNSQVLVSQTFF
jgi:hypothetical protein